MNVFGNGFNVDYRRLLPSASQDTLEDDGAHYGIYEDDETQEQRRAEGLNSENPVTRTLAQISEMMPSLGLQERVLGCATCMICGYLLSFGSFVRMKSLLGGNPVPIVFHITLGNILTLCGTCFLTGPTAQIHRMWHTSRRGASIMYLGSLWITVILLLLPNFVTRGLMLVLLLIFQYIAITWYCLSYIPFARDIAKRFCLRMFNSADADV